MPIDTTTTTTTNTANARSRTSSRGDTTLRLLLMTLHAQQPNISNDDLEELFLEKARRKPLLVNEALRLAFGKYSPSILQSASAAPSQRRQVSPADLAATGQTLRTIITLDLMMPNGKKLRHCNRADLRQIGGWVSNLADGLNDDHGEVGGRYSDADVVAAFASARS